MSGESVLLIDNSNTRTKFAFACNGLLHAAVDVLPTAELSPDAVRRLLDGRSPRRAIVCSVVPRAAAILASALPCPVQSVTADACAELLRCYPGRATLGADRIANAAAVAAAGLALPCIAVDLGTACTFDVVDHRDGAPRFVGGAIAPGLQAMAASLSGCTALLPATDTRDLPACPPIGATTRDALRSGLLYGYTGMLRGIAHRLAAALDSPPSFVITGGDALLWPTDLPFAYTIDKSLTFKGMLSIF